MKDLTVIMKDRPGKLAELGEATGKAGVNIEGLCAMVADEREAVIVDLHDKPGAMGEIARDLAEAGVSVDVAYTIFSGVRLVIVTEDVEAARKALELNGAAA
jgi:hypothetical protein